MTSLQTSVLVVLLALLSGAGVAVAPAQRAEAQDNVTFTGESVRADFEYLYDTLASAHFDLYAYRSREDYASYYEELLAAIQGPMTRLDTVRLFTPFVTFGRVGHARINFPVQDYIAYVLAGGTLLPLDVRVEDGRVLITHNYSGLPALAPGTELLEINGRPAADWIDRIGRLVSAERPYMVHAQLESMFPRLTWLDLGEIDAFELVVRSGSGKVKTFMVDAVPAMTVEEQKGAREAAQHSRKAQLLAHGVAYLRPGPFYAASDGDSLERFTVFIDDAFQQFIDAGATDLVIDLRNNPGGDNSFSDPLIAWFADERFRFAAQFIVKASPRTRMVLEGLAEEYPGGISAQMLEAMTQHEDGATFPFAIPLVAPRDAGFSGRVWVLINRHSYSNATTVAAIIQDYGFGTILGEETADVPTSYASSAQFTLPNTGVAVTYPKAYFIRPNGDERLQGVVPDHPLVFPVVPTAGDDVLRQAVEFIASQRSGQD